MAMFFCSNHNLFFLFCMFHFSLERYYLDLHLQKYCIQLRKTKSLSYFLFSSLLKTVRGCFFFAFLTTNDVSLVFRLSKSDA